MKFQH